ncbi:LysR family transcriptional regulator [Paraburkholderia sp. CNPSo 3076]|uniref:LysR family transcriptional regulator n=1 Tax=Paraburkholderia sp. CNPSo 3076 TaxID=2940936 RepID=UPI002258E9A7|nr:LysR family transcriptional regulator [Paraburkholderia sp. CNPSo 3076]MCX5544713.1 LysR family transcriptional regulator [Paraburkholderia sp. CNPSo 3076]
MNQLQAMRVFTRVVDLSSFNLAGKQLGMSAAAVTCSVGMLEAHLNMRLLNRSTRSLSLTEAGRLYLDGCRAVIEKLDEVESELVRATRDPSGVLRIAAPAVFASSGLPAVLGAYRAVNPRVEFDVTAYDTHIDLIEGGFDVCFATDRQSVNASLVSRKLTSIKEMLVPTPAWLARHGMPRDPAELAGHGLLAVSDAPRHWEFSNAEGVQRINVNGPMTANGYATVRAAALADMGIALPLPLVADDLARGALLPVLNAFDVNGGMQHISIVYSGRNCLTMKIRSFIDFAVEQFRTNAAQTRSAPAPLRAVA